MYLARCYAPLRKYGQALTLLQHANIQVRETYGALSLLDSDPISAAESCFFPLTDVDVKEIESSLASDILHFKQDWFAHNGGSVDADPKSYKKPVFFNIALNYVELDMNRLLERAGKQPVPLAPIIAASTQKKAEPSGVSEKKSIGKTKIEDARAATPEPQAPARGGLSSLLGGWWGKS